MSHPASKPTRERRLGQASEPSLFSHEPQAEVFEQHDSPVGEGVDWRSAPFTVGPGERRHGVAPDDGT